ncbi:unnamed protein product [Mytilus coruscus]|uniref:Uncharacterized protein n=1 Tax=Mytilus coruscus TaxID=42192 RepID=A0A6J8AMV1_MYTCO|nr:unnamed protein product [Mytilus coruscus]
MKFKWETISPELFLNALKSDEIKVKIQDFENIQNQSQSEVDAALHWLHDILKMAANKSLKRKTKSRRNGIKSKPWFDKGLSTMRKELDHKSQMLVKYPKDPIIRGNFFKFRKLYGKKYQTNICFTTRPITPITESIYKENIKKNEITRNKKLAFCTAKGADDSEPWATQYEADISAGTITSTTLAKDVATILWCKHSNTYDSKRAIQVPSEEAGHVVKCKRKSTETENQYGKRRVPEMPPEEEIDNTNADDTGAIMSINTSRKYTMSLGKKALKEKIENKDFCVDLFKQTILQFIIKDHRL